MQTKPLNDDAGQAIEASGDALVIAHALHDIADAIRSYATAMSSDQPGEPAQPETYLCGAKIER